jgi:protein-glutamine gamma-glutamyltransferase
MTFLRSYRVSLYVMLTLAALILNIDATQTNRIAILFPFGVAGACAIAFFTVDRRPSSGLSRDLANWLAFCSLGLAILERSVDPDQLVMALGHWLVYLSVIQIFLPAKSARDDWYLFTLALVQVLIGGYISQSDYMGLLFLAWALSTLWALGLSHLHRESARGRSMTPPAPEQLAASRAGADPYPGLFDPAFYRSAVRVAATTLALGGLIFLLMPRWESRVGLRGPTAAAKHLTGFTDEVRIGQIGEILENDSIVMTVWLKDDDDNLAQPEGEPLWRGVVMQTYEGGNWHRQPPVYPVTPIQPDVRPPGKLIHQKFQLQTSDSDALFCLRPVMSAKTRRANTLALNSVDGTLYRKDMRPEGGFSSEPTSSSADSFDYEVVSLIQGTRIQPGEDYPSLRKIQNKLLKVPDDIVANLEAFAKPIVDALPPADREDRIRVAQALERHFLDSGKFTYSLKMTILDPEADPVVDFLENRKEGHCAYYASALTLLLRSQGIPARMVNGFKGGDWNDLLQGITVRQKHAHSWVEALVSENLDGPADWLTLDPTPGTERDASVARVGGGASRFRGVSDFLRFIWTFYIVGFNSDRQQRLIYEPVKQLITYAMDGFRFMGRGLASLVAWFLHFRNFQDFFSGKGFVVSITVMLAVVFLGRLLARVWKRLAQRRSGENRDGSTMGTGVAIYNRLARLLKEIGLERTPAETPREFARRASSHLATRDAEAESISEAPPVVVDAFYRIRFGGDNLSAEALSDLDTRLDALEARCSGGPAAGVGST